VRVPELTRTVSPITIRSNGFSSTRSGTIVPGSKTRASVTAHDVTKHRSDECTADTPPSGLQGIGLEGGGRGQVGNNLVGGGVVDDVGSERRFWRTEAMSFMVNRILRCRLSSPSRRRRRRMPRKAGDCERPPIAAHRAVERSLAGRQRKISDEPLA
jgi:hypothetical protein